MGDGDPESVQERERIRRRRKIEKRKKKRNSCFQHYGQKELDEERDRNKDL